jgi:hypothetical protein
VKPVEITPIVEDPAAVGLFLAVVSDCPEVAESLEYVYLSVWELFVPDEPPLKMPAVTFPHDEMPFLAVPAKVVAATIVSVLNVYFSVVLIYSVLYPAANIPTDALPAAPGSDLMVLSDVPAVRESV